MRRHARWVAGTLPKSGSPKRPPEPPPGTERIQRLIRANRKALVGRPLTSSLSRSSVVREGRPYRLYGIALTILGGGLVAATLLGGFPAWLAGAGAITLGAASALAWRYRATSVSPPDMPGMDLGRAAERLDAFLAEVSPHLPAAALATLARVKATLAQVLATLEEGGDRAPGVSGEESFFTHAMVSRYVPDACRHYMDAASAAGRTGLLRDGRTLEDSLCRQLESLQSRLARIQANLAAGKAERLANHEAFLRTKN